MATTKKKPATTDPAPEIASPTVLVTDLLALIEEDVLLGYIKEYTELLIFSGASSDDDEKAMAVHLREKGHKVFHKDKPFIKILEEYEDDINSSNINKLIEIVEFHGYTVDDDEKETPVVAINTLHGGLNDAYLAETIDELLFKYSPAQLAEHLKQLA